MSVRPIAQPQEEVPLHALLRKGRWREALRATLTTVGPDVAGFCMALTGDAQTAASIVRATFCALEDVLPQLEGQPLRRWLLADALQRCRREQAARRGAATASSSPQKRLAIRRSPAETRSALSALRRNDREILVLRYVGRLDYPAIASLCDTSPEAVQRQIGRALVAVLQETAAPNPRDDE